MKRIALIFSYIFLLVSLVLWFSFLLSAPFSDGKVSIRYIFMEFFVVGGIYIIVERILAYVLDSFEVIDWDKDWILPGSTLGNLTLSLYLLFIYSFSIRFYDILGFLWGK